MVKVGYSLLVDVGEAEGFPDRTIRAVDVGGRRVGVVRWGQELFALQNACPHQGGPLCEGMVLSGPRPAGVGSLDVDEREPVVSCGWHGWQFYARTGRSVWENGCRVASYPAEVRDGRVMLDVPSSWRFQREA